MPHTFVDMFQLKEWSSYIYSLAHNKQNADVPQNPTVDIILNYAPIKMILLKKPREVGEFLINLCSVIGGVFIIGGLINGFYLRVCALFK